MQENDQGFPSTRKPVHDAVIQRRARGRRPSYRLQASLARSKPMAPIRGIQGSVVAGPKIPLNTRASADQDIRPELSTAQGWDPRRLPPKRAMTAHLFSEHSLTF